MDELRMKGGGPRCATVPIQRVKEYLSHGIGRSFQVPEILGGIASPNSNLPLRAFGFEYGTMLIEGGLQLQQLA